MNRILIIILLSMFFINNYSFGQITLSPEIGFSYRPFTLYGANTENISNRLDLSVGVSAELPIAKKWYINTRISYSNREDMKWTDHCLCPGYLYNELVHSDINLDFILMLNIETFRIGAGPSFVKTFGRIIDEYELTELNRTFSGTSEIFGVNARVSFVLSQNVLLNVFYARTISRVDSTFSPKGYNRIDFTISYALLNGKR